MITPKPAHINAFIFSVKAAAAAVVSVVCFNLTHLPGTAWAAVSAVIVTQPGLHPSVKASLVRVIANLIGAFVGAVLSAFFGHGLLSLAIGVMITGMICHFTHLDDALRPAYAAVVILILTTDSTWFGSLDRVFAVIVGCGSALAVGLLFGKSTKLLGIGTDSHGSE
ncbi:MAG: aromatic acid exporter family protein [Chthoniobacteraceae bacterium]